MSQPTEGRTMLPSPSDTTSAAKQASATASGLECPPAAPEAGGTPLAVSPERLTTSPRPFRKKGRPGTLHLALPKGFSAELGEQAWVIQEPSTATPPNNKDTGNNPEAAAMNRSEPGQVRKEPLRRSKEDGPEKTGGPLNKSDPLSTERDERKRSKRASREKKAAERMMEWRAATKDKWTSSDESPPLSPRGASGGLGFSVAPTGIYNGFVLPHGKQHGKEADGSSLTQQTELLPGESLVVVHEGVVVGLNQARVGQLGNLHITNFRLSFYSKEAGRIMDLPLALILNQKVETKGRIEGGLLYLLCKDLRTVYITFTTTEGLTQTKKWIKQNIFPPKVTSLFAFKSGEPPAPALGFYDLHNEFMRQGALHSDWRITSVNKNYKLCVSYPKMFVVPSSIKDDDLINTAPLHHKGRTIALCWHHPSSKAALLRRSYDPQSPDSQHEDPVLEHLWRLNPGTATRKNRGGKKPESGVWVMNCDRRKKNPLSNSLSTTGNQVITIQKVTLAGLRRITPPLSSSTGGARKTTLSPTTDRAGAGGSGGDEDEATFIQHFTDIPDREHVKASLVKLREVLYTTKSGYALLDYDDGGAKEATGNASGGGAQGDGSTRSDLMSTSSSTISLASVDNDTAQKRGPVRIEKKANWIYQISKMLEMVEKVVNILEKGESVVVQNFNGRDAVSTIVSLVQICVDPYYRTMHGFAVLIEKEWIAFGHKFGQNRTKKHADESLSGVFLMFLDCVFQLWDYSPHQFQFNDSFLLFLIDSVYNGRFTTFLSDSEKLRASLVAEKTASIWAFATENEELFSNFLYSPPPANAPGGLPAATVVSAAAFKPLSKQSSFLVTASLGSSCSTASTNPLGEAALSDGTTDSLSSPRGGAPTRPRASTVAAGDPATNAPSSAVGGGHATVRESLILASQSKDHLRIVPPTTSRVLHVPRATEIKFWATYFMRWIGHDSTLNAMRIIRSVQQTTDYSALKLSNRGLHVLPYEVGLLDRLVKLHLSNNQLSTFPVFLGQLQKLETLDLSQNRLMSISYHLAVSLPFLKKLQILLLQHNQIATALPFQMSALENLTELDLSHNKLDHQLMPSSFGRKCELSTHLRRLNLSHNRFTKFPERTLSPLINLEFLSLADNNLTEIPFSLFQLTNLLELDLGNNKLKSFPTKIIEGATGGNKDESNSHLGLAKLKRLHIFNLDNNPDLRTLPLEMFALGSSLCRLNLRAVGLSVLPSMNFSYVTKALGNVNFTSLTNLQILDLSHNRIKVIPNQFWGLSQLLILKLGHNALTELSPHVRQLTALRSLQLAHNELKAICEEIVYLKNLTALDVRHNDLEELPPQLGMLSQLQTLKLDENRHLVSPPKEIVAMGSAHVLRFLSKLYQGHERLYRMKLMFVGQENAGKTTLMKCLANRDKDVGRKERVMGQIKVLAPLTLRRGAGNSLAAAAPLSTDGIDIEEWTLKMKVRRTRTGTLSSSSEQVDVESLPPLPHSASADGAPTSPRALQPGLSNSGSLIEDYNEPKDVTLTLWDFAGQEIYYTTHEFFLSERSLYLVIFNLSKGLNAAYMEHWLQSIVARAPDAPVMIVGTHLDQCAEDQVEAIALELTEKYSARFPNIKTVKFVSCSLGKGLGAVQEAIEEVVGSQEHMGERMPKSYMALERALIAERAKRVPPVLSWEEFRELAKRCGVDDDLGDSELPPPVSDTKKKLKGRRRKEEDKRAKSSDLYAATQLLHNLGSLVHFRNDEKLRNIVVLDPQWLTKVMATVFTTKQSFSKNGILPHSNLAQIWRPPSFPPELHPFLLQLLHQFDIAITLNLKDTSEKFSLLPSLLPDNPPDDLQSLWPMRKQPGDMPECIEFGRNYQFDFIPKGFFAKIMVRLLSLDLQATCYWRYGMVAVVDNDKIALEWSEKSKVIKISLRTSRDKLNAGNTNRSLFSLAVGCADSLVADWYNLKTKVMVPCVHCLEWGKKRPRMFGLEECRLAVMRGESHAYCSPVIAVRYDHLVPDIALTDLAQNKINYASLDIKEKIGEGSFSVVYKGIYNNEEVAIKRLKFNDEKIRENRLLKAFDEFRNEVFLMSGLKHPNIITMAGFCTKPSYCIVTEFVSGGTLLELLQNEESVIDWSLRLRLAKDIAKGVAFLHSCSPPIVHRDLKSPNVLLVSMDDDAPVLAKIADFGLSAAMIQSAMGRKVDCPVWLAPEIMRNQEYTTKADVYSMGIILWELLTKQQKLFSEVKFMIQLEDRILTGERPPIPDDCVPAYRQLIEECWNHEPEKRPNMDDIVARLQALLAELCPGVADYDKAVLHRESEANGAADGDRTEGILSSIAHSSARPSSSLPSDHRQPPSSSTALGIHTSHPGTTRYQPAASSNPLSLSSPPALTTPLSPTATSAAAVSGSPSPRAAAFDPASVPAAASLHFPYFALQNPAAFFPRFQHHHPTTTSSPATATSPADSGSTSPSSTPTSPVLSAYPYVSSPYPFPFPMPSPYLPPFPPPFPAGTHAHTLALARDDPLHWTSDRVGEWLDHRDVACGQHRAALKKFNGRALIRLTEEQVDKLLPASDKADAILLFQHIQDLRDLSLYCSIHQALTSSTSP